MAITIIASGIISLLVATIVVLMACKIQAHFIHKTNVEDEAWQHAQEAQQNLWEVKQREQALDQEQWVNKHIQEIHEAWQRWKSDAPQRLTQVTVEQTIAALHNI